MASDPAEHITGQLWDESSVTRQWLLVMDGPTSHQRQSDMALEHRRLTEERDIYGFFEGRAKLRQKLVPLPCMTRTLKFVCS